MIASGSELKRVGRVPESRAEEEEVRSIVLGLLNAIEGLDVDALDSRFSRSTDLLAYGQGRTSRCKTWDEVNESHRQELQNLKSVKLTSRELEVHVRGRIAWIADRPIQSVVTNDGKHFEVELRITAVLEKEEPEEEWRIIQWHGSRGT